VLTIRFSPDPLAQELPLLSLACSVMSIKLNDSNRGRAMAKKTKAKDKASVKTKSRQSSLAKKPVGAPFSEQDPKRRLGNFSGTGEHPRKGGRTTGIVGQTRERVHSDKKSTR
jgi:hypothetical protein